MEKVVSCFCEKFIHLGLIIPESCFGKFILGFGRVFHEEDAKGMSWLKKVDNYEDPGLHLEMSVDISFPASEKKKFFDFLQEFCTKRHIGYPSFEEIFGK